MHFGRRPYRAFGCIDFLREENSLIRVGENHLRAELKTLREVGLSNRSRLRVMERNCFIPTCTPLSSVYTWTT
jgi:hypothetical protein